MKITVWSLGYVFMTCCPWSPQKSPKQNKLLPLPCVIHHSSMGRPYCPCLVLPITAPWEDPNAEDTTHFGWKLSPRPSSTPSQRCYAIFSGEKASVTLPIPGPYLLQNWPHRQDLPTSAEGSRNKNIKMQNYKPKRNGNGLPSVLSAVRD